MLTESGRGALSRLPAHNLAAVVSLHAAARPDASSLVERRPTADGWERRSFTWREFEQAITDAASGLEGLGLVAGQRVMILAINSIASVTAWFGALRAGIVAVPVNPDLSKGEISRLVAHSGAHLLLGRAGQEVPGVTVVALEDLRNHRTETPVASILDPEAIAAILYTTGTSGQPKGVMMSHRALLSHCESAFQVGLMASDAIVLACMPLSHAYGLNAILGAAVYAGATTVLVDGVPTGIDRIRREEGITHLPVTPSALYRFTQGADAISEADALRMVTCGAAPLPVALAEHFRRLVGISVHQGYGMTEASTGISTTLGHQWLGVNHVGRALPGVEIRIGDGSHPTEPGLIWVRGNNLFSGYWPDGADGPDAQGWFATGDVGYLDGPELFLLSRLREMVIVSGFNVYPSEIEEVLEEHPDVDSAAVIGQPDDETGERIVAFITGDEVNSSHVLAYAATRLAGYKMPSQVLVIPAMPRTPNGKIRRGLLRDLLDRTEDEDQ